MATTSTGAIAALLLASLSPATPQLQEVHHAGTLYATTTDHLGVGAAVRIRGGPPWSIQTLANTDGGHRLRQFGKLLYVVNPAGGTITRTTIEGGWSQVYNLGAGSEPQDILVPQLSFASTASAFVTRRHDPHLHRLHLASGLGADVLDLSPVGAGYPIALGTMERDGNRLFVQVRIFDAPSTATKSVPGGDSGVLAVVDLGTMTLVDVNPTQPGIQGVELQGAPPHLKMQIIQETRTLFVSATEDHLDTRGGIEMVHLDSLTSMGYAISEAQFSDLGGFVMTSALGGFFVFHTDLAASTHLKRFTIAGGADPGPEMIVLLGSQQEVLTYDPVRKRIFMPSGNSLPSSNPGLGYGIHVFDAITKQRIGAGPIDTGLRPADVLVQ